MELALQMNEALYRQKRREDRVEAAALRCGSGPDALLPILQDVHAADGHLTHSVLGATSDRLRVPDARTFGVASFYSMLSTNPRSREVVRVCDGPVCCLHGGAAVRSAVEGLAADQGICVERTSCLGLCDRAPAALVGLEPVGPIAASDAQGVLSRAPGNNAPSYAEPLEGEVRVALQRFGRIDPDEIEGVLDGGVYPELASALRHRPQQVLESVIESGLQGRGGAAFPTGAKWKMVAEAAGSPKYIVCNADESEPAAFKDRVLMEGDPHLLLEGMALAGHAVGASQGYIYIRGEYETAAQRLERAVRQAQEHGCLGANICGSQFSFQIHLHRGAGAYICGEETALLESLEGRRGEPRIRPPYPATQGLFGLPTVVNNVETLCKVPAILAKGAAWYRSLGTRHSPGTKLFCVSGHVNRPGVFEAPFGITLRHVIEQFGGGISTGAAFKMALIGGAAGTIVGPNALDLPLDFAAQVTLGCGAILVLDESVSVLDVLGWLLHFFEFESCGKCTPCREGTHALKKIVERWMKDDGRPGDLKRMSQISKLLQEASLCGLGQSVPWAIDSAMKAFPKEFPSFG